MKLGEVNAFEMGTPKERALKPLEEAAEILGAYQNLKQWKKIQDEKRIPADDALHEQMKKDCFLEIADCITACCNFAAYFGCDNLIPYLKEVEDKNRERGRYKTS